MTLKYNIKGQRFGRLVAKNYVGDGKWECLCDCGQTKIVKSNHLVHNYVKSCGCLKKVREEKIINIVGKRFGRLKVIELVGRKHKEALWKCQCDCGNIVNVSSYSLRNGITQSCGCKKIDELVQRVVTHHKTKTRLYQVYEGIKARCFNPNTIRYSNYGGRGITICDKWKNDFQAFYDWAMANGYDETAERGECTIDRIDNNGDYCPENCRWVTMQTQSVNKRNSKKIPYNGQEHTITEWSKILKIKQPVLSYRLAHGWSVEKAFTVY